MCEFKYEDRVVARIIESETGKDTKRYAIFCPACRCAHVFDERWTFNGDFDKPTFRASMLVNQQLKEPKIRGNHVSHRCHSFVTDGKIKFLGDCTHDMKNTEVKLEKF